MSSRMNAHIILTRSHAGVVGLRCDRVEEPNVGRGAKDCSQYRQAAGAIAPRWATYQMCFAAISITTASTMTIAAIWTNLSLALVCIFMLERPRNEPHRSGATLSRALGRARRSPDWLSSVEA
jgi:hypothetical protein